MSDIKKRFVVFLLAVCISLVGASVGPSRTLPHTRTTPDKIAAQNAQDFEVIRVVDGDTIVVAFNHEPETVRLIGINTPETVAPNRPVDCYGPEASAFLKELLTHKIVELVSDPSQDDLDKYKRLLRYVYLDGENINALLIEKGFAREYTYKKAYEHQAQFRGLQKAAKKYDIGLWGACETP